MALQETKKQTSEQLEEFYKRSSDWAYDNYHSQSLWLKRTIILIVLLSLMLCLTLISNLFLFPLKEKVPYLYSFDKETGEITKLEALEPTHLPADWVMTRYFIIHYIIDRESYDYYNVDYPYQIAWAMSDEPIRKEYETTVNSNAKTSPYQMYGKAKYITISIISVSKLNNNTATVRFEKVLHNREAGTQQVSHREAIIKWKYIKEPVTQKVLDRNPLGFKVTYYQVAQVNLD